MAKQKQDPQIEWGFHAVIPRLVRTNYEKLTPVQKWLYVCLKDLCGEHGTCYRALRVLATETGISIGMLSESIRCLHDAGLIHAEKKRRNNNPTAKEVWHITIVDIWQANAKEHPTKRSQNEHYKEGNVHTVNNNVHTTNDIDTKRSPAEQQCSHSETEEVSLTSINIEAVSQSSNIVATSAEDRTHAENVTPYEKLQKRITDNHLKAVSSHSQLDIRNEKGQADESVHTATANLLLPQSRAVGPSNEMGFHLDTQIGNEDDFDADAHERSVIDAFLDADTVKVAAVKIGANNGLHNTTSLDHSNKLNNHHDTIDADQDHPGLPTQALAVKIGANNGSNRHSSPDNIPEFHGNRITHNSHRNDLPARQLDASQQKPDAGVPLSLATDPPVSRQDDAASGQAVSSFSPSQDAAQRTMTGANGAVQASIPKRPRAKKAVTMPDDTPAPQPKSDTREIQRRINEHRGYALEEKTDKIREATAVKSWCGMHTLEEYERVMRYLKHDSYWGKPENNCRIGGLTLAKETPKALANGKRNAEPDTSRIPNFDDYVGNGPEERAARLVLYEEMKARGELIS